MSNIKEEESNNNKDKIINSQRLPIFGRYHTPYNLESYRADKKNIKNISIKTRNSEYGFTDWKLQKSKSEGIKKKYSQQIEDNGNNLEKKINENTNITDKEFSNKESIIKKVVNFFKIKKKKSSQDLCKMQTYTELEPTEMLERSNRKIINKKKKRNKIYKKITKKASSVTSINVINEPGIVKEICPLEEYNTTKEYSDLIEQVKKENEKINFFDIKCNIPCNPGDLIIDKRKFVTFIFKRSPLMNLLLYQDEIVRINGENFEVDEEECILPVEPCQRLDLVIRRRGRSLAVPFKRQLNTNLDMEYGYYYFVVTVPRIKNQLIGIEFYNTPEDGIIVQNVIKNTVGYHLFSQGDYICDINNISIKTSEEFFKILTDDIYTFPTFSCIVKRSCAKPTQLKVVKTLFECPDIKIKSDVMKIVKNEEQKLMINDNKKKKPCTILKDTSYIQNFISSTKMKGSIIPTSNRKKIEKYSVISTRSSKKNRRKKNVKIIDAPKTKEIESDIENVVFINPVPNKFTSF
ncbi:Hypothetical protein SRAE_1000355400 [Strongyloides ratti]|uniref:PDZ domain-containing protein n=1 Tax=Strongyloides ratti TaxID=34506 RepID=A0A090L675_STRRB|nr:Hypothetical protein SRAE_1000355400 [Strongyloides ratti]CEF65301.1 Hypothetical protein SRAE_1000355400 [Strongyloides ratti]